MGEQRGNQRKDGEMTHRIGRTLRVLGVLGVLMTGRSAAAQDGGARDGGAAIELGLHLGYMVPFGHDGRIVTEFPTRLSAGQAVTGE